MHDLDVVCFGEALVDLLPARRGKLRDCEQFEAHSGGAPANVAVGLARDGKRVAFAGVVGEDELGHLLLRKLREEGVETQLRMTREAPTGLWFVALDERGERSFFSPTRAASADKLNRSDDLPEALLARTCWLHVGSSAHIRPEAQEALLDALRRARARGVRTSFDPNVRIHLWADPAELRALVERAFPLCEVVKLSDEEIGPCLGVDSPEAALEQLAARGVSLPIVTLGPKGAVARWKGEVLRVEAPRIDVVDTTGAGDGFVSALLAGLVEIPEPKQQEEIRELLSRACEVGAKVCTAMGAVAGLPRRGGSPRGMAGKTP